MALRFVPPKLLAKYAVFIDHGNGRGFFKTYDTIGAAKSSYRAHVGFRWRREITEPAKILEMVDGEWFTLYDMEKGSKMLPWQKDFGQGDWYRRGGIRTTQMTLDEYGSWRAQVERERIERKGVELATQSSN